MGNYGRNAQLRAFHAAFTMKRDHKVAGPRFCGSGNLGSWYECETCGEMVDRSGRGFRHQPRHIKESER